MNTHLSIMRNLKAYLTALEEAARRAGSLGELGEQSTHEHIANGVRTKIFLLKQVMDKETNAVWDSIKGAIGAP